MGEHSSPTLLCISEKQQAEHRTQESEARNRARGENTKPDTVIVVSRYESEAVGRAEIPLIITPGAAAQDAIDLLIFIPGICPFPNIATQVNNPFWRCAIELPNKSCGCST